MHAFKIRVGMLVFWNNWLWVVSRQINTCWRLRRLGDNLVMLTTPGQWSEAVRQGELTIITTRSAPRLLALQGSELTQMLKLLRRSSPGSRGDRSWTASST